MIKAIVISFSRSAEHKSQGYVKGIIDWEDDDKLLLFAGGVRRVTGKRGMKRLHSSMTLKLG